MPEYTFAKAQVGIDQQLELLSLVTGVEVTGYIYYNDGLGSRTVYSATLAVGSYIIKFEEPHYAYSISSGATIVEYSEIWMEINVTVAGLIEITAGNTNAYSTQVYSVTNDDVLTGTKAKIISVDEVTMITAANGTLVAQHLYDYYQQKFRHFAKLFATFAGAGNRISIETLYGQSIRGTIEQAEFDLTGGFVAQIQTVGDVEV